MGMLFSKLARYLAELEKTSSRNEITKILADVFKEADKEEVRKISYLLSGELLPAYMGTEINVAEKMMIQVLSRAYKKLPREVVRIYKVKGDLGDTSFELAQKNRTPGSSLGVGEVYDKLLELATHVGGGSQEKKVAALAELLVGLDPLSVKFVTRIPVGKLRLGFSEATLLDALSYMEKGDKSARPQIERAFNVTADIGEIAERIKKHGLEPLKRIEPKPGIPIRPSLAERLQGLEEVISKAGPIVGVEQKLDGFRTQVHVWHESGKKRVALFSRNLENTTPMFPEIVKAAQKLSVKSIILDGETIGYNPKSKKFMSFQETVQRKRKHDIEKFAQKIPLTIFIFDILYLDGKSLLHFSARERHKILEKSLRGVNGTMRVVKQRLTDDYKVIAEELKNSLKLGLEGLVVKNLEVPYQAGSRGFHWIKLKSTSTALSSLRAIDKKGTQKLHDTIDCVIMGAWRGRGKRATFGVGGFLLGVRGPDDKYYTISRLGTGLSDAQFREAKKRIEKFKSKEKPKEYVADKEIKPDLWIKPSLVAEILSDEISRSPRHTAGRQGEKRGYSLRFPRLVRFRDDKNPKDATAIKEIVDMYKNQSQAGL